MTTENGDDAYAETQFYPDVKTAQCQRANIVYYKPCKAGKSLCHLPHRRQHLFGTTLQGKASRSFSAAAETQMYRSKGTDYREIYTQYEPQQVLTDFTEEFRRRYGVECVSALHHNKRKTNYHIHLIFSERRLLPEPDVKGASRSVFFDETGKRVRTKKGKSRGRTGRYGKAVPSSKKARYTKAICLLPKIHALRESLLREIKEVYTELINCHISDLSST